MLPAFHNLLHGVDGPSDLLKAMPVLIVGPDPVQHGLGGRDELNVALEKRQSNNFKEADLQATSSRELSSTMVKRLAWCMLLWVLVYRMADISATLYAVQLSVLCFEPQQPLMHKVEGAAERELQQSPFSSVRNPVDAIARHERRLPELRSPGFWPCQQTRYDPLESKSSC